MDPASTENPLQILLKQLEANEVDALAKECGMTGGIDSVEVLDTARSQALQMEEDAKVLRSKIARIENGTLRSELTAFARPPRAIDGSRFWAVLIGIDGYRTNPLRGCVSDALEMNDYLLNDLGVPKEHIQLLLGPSGKHCDHCLPVEYSNPSRSNIINTLCELITNPKIEKDDNIVIYFAGHGSCYDYPDCSYPRSYKYGNSEISFGNLRMIRSLCPIDREAWGSSVCKEPDISNREIDAILNQLSLEKGHHITFIQDAGNGLTIEYQTSEMRNVQALHPVDFVRMLEAADDTARRLPAFREKPSIWELDWNEDSASHVVLAATETGHYTHERQYGDTGFHGIFTRSLVLMLKSDELRKRPTFRDLISCLPRTMQTAVVSGEHKNAPLWYQK
ncbi:uncharacterized protein EV420DRAFT_1643733 [Desarmillaria tabescens]|uniref:Peptidase C14 caspase domain-containing protein n=1 Tax=Armillaria tabescens TaxID=1929756 RepID=A0AA39KB76_ARMTA|nr:uncharacterized protein EV420DRAFT_1643733 [Desarmillaria tabescens]KAK0457885.1 hypothetical protein EV420DRAFT_1643733 [Desarmillaria tabescens]